MTMMQNKQGTYEMKLGPYSGAAAQLALYQAIMSERGSLNMQETQYNAEELYEAIRSLHLQLLDANESDDTATRRKANIEADRYLMANKEVLLPILVDALGKQIRGVRDVSDATEAQMAAARLTAAEDTYAAYLRQQQEEADKGASFFSRLFRVFKSNVGLPYIQHATETNSVIASPGCTVKTKDGRFGLVKHKYETGLLEVLGPDGLMAVNESELLIVIAPQNKQKDGAK